MKANWDQCHKCGRLKLHADGGLTHDVDTFIADPRCQHFQKASKRRPAGFEFAFQTLKKRTNERWKRLSQKSKNKHQKMTTQ